MKKFLFMVTLALLAGTAKAQFQAGKAYLGASLTGLDMHYNGQNGFNIGLEAKAGLLFTDNWMMLGSISLNHNGSEAVADHLAATAGLRYYIVQNGLFLGLNGKYVHAEHNYNDVMPGAELGYAFFVTRSDTIEPEVYYYHSLKKTYNTRVGLKIGIGIYLFDD